MNNDPEPPGTPDLDALDAEQGMTRPEPTDDTSPDASSDDVEPAFDIDLEPDEQGLADAGGEPTG
jgi:hypothetical protein